MKAWFTLLLSPSLALGCAFGCALGCASENTPALDASSVADANQGTDADHQADAHGSLDANGPDARPPMDAGAVTDAAMQDAQVSTDAGPPLPEQRGVTAARAARDFVDSVGVNTHVGYTDRNYWDFPQLASTIAELGVRHIRDGQPASDSYMNPQSTAGIVTTRMQTLMAAGVKATLISGYPVNASGAVNFALAQLPVFAYLGDGIAAFEHTNEPDLFAARTDAQWDSHLRSYMPVLWQLRNMDAALMSMPVLSPSVAGAAAFQSFATGFPNQADFITHCNVHPYPGGAPPESNALRALGSCRAFVGDRPVVATETGYHTAINDTSGHQGVSATAQGIYIPRLFLEYFLQGFTRVHSYELLDEYADPLNNQREAQFGLVRLDWSKKPAFIALRHLLSLLTDGDAPFSPSGTVLHLSDRNVRSVLLEKRDGSFWIALWRPVSVFDLGTKTDLAVAPTPVTLSFSAAPTQLIQHALSDPDPSTSLTPAASIAVNVGAEVVLLEARGLPRFVPRATVVDDFDDLGVVSASQNVFIEHNPVRMQDFDDGLGVAMTDGAQLTYDVTELSDFSLRGYFFCAGCINDPLQAIGFQVSSDGVYYTTIAHDVVDRRPTMDAREVVTFVPHDPIPAGTNHLRILLGRAAPKLADLTLQR